MQYIKKIFKRVNICETHFEREQIIGRVEAFIESQLRNFFFKASGRNNLVHLPMLRQDILQSFLVTGQLTSRFFEKDEIKSVPCCMPHVYWGRILDPWGE